MNHARSCIPILVLLCVTLMPALVFSTSVPCIDYRDYFNWDSTIPVSLDYVSNLALDGDVLFSIEGNIHYQGLLRSIDVSNPLSPRTIASLELYETTSGLVASDSRLLVGANDHWLRLFDVSNPSAFVELEHVDLAQPIQDILIAEDYAYVSVGNYTPQDGLYILSLHSSSLLEVEGFLPLSDGPSDLAIKDDYLYVDLLNTPSYLIVDVTSPSGPFVAATIEDPNVEPSQSVIHDNLLYMIDLNGGIRILDVTNPLSPQLVGSLSEGNFPLGLSMGENRLFLMTEDHLSVYELSDPVNPQHLGSIPGIFWSAVSGSGFMYTAGLKVVGASELSSASYSPSPVFSQIDTPGSVHDILLLDDVAILADFTRGIRILSLADVSNPSVISSLISPSFWADKLFWKSPHLFVGTVNPIEGGGMTIVDLSQMGSPTKLGSIDLPEVPTDLTVLNEVAWVSTALSGLHAIDVSTPSSPQSLLVWEPEGELRAIESLDNEHLLLAGNFPLTILNVSNVTSPYVVSKVDQCADGIDLRFENGLVYLTTREGRFWTLDPTSIELPTILGSANSYRFNHGLAVDDHYAYARDNSGISILDISSAWNPQVLGHINEDDDWGIDSAGGLIVTATGEEGICLLHGQCQSTSAPVRVPSNSAFAWFPNPFREHSDFSIQNEILSPLRVDIYDVRGRLQFQLENGALPVGRHRIQWDGKDRMGRAVPPGVYFTKIQVGGEVSDQKIVRIR